MMKEVFGRAVRVGRATALTLGVAVMLALVLGVATTALGANGGSFILGKAGNAATKVTGLVSNVAEATQSALLVRNSGPGTALDLKVGSQTATPASKTTPPMKVDSQAKVDNLNADEIDGKDSSEFLGKTEKAADAAHADQADTAGSASSATNAQNAANANTLDGIDSAGFVQGRGAAYRGQQDLPPGSSFVQTIMRTQSPDLLIGYICPSDPAGTGRVSLYNTGSESVDMFSDNGGENPNIYRQLGPNQNSTQDTSPSGERVTFQAQGNSGTATVEVFSVHNANGCHVQAQALVAR